MYIIAAAGDVVKLNHFVPLVELSVVSHVLPVVSDADVADHSDVEGVSEEDTVEDRHVATGGQSLDGDFLR